MNVISVECPQCRSIHDVPASCLLLEIGHDSEDPESGSSAAWICDHCDALVALTIDLVVLLKLIAAGGSVLDTAVDDLETTDGQAASDPLTLDDLLDFHEHLADDALLAEELCHDCGDIE